MGANLAVEEYAAPCRTGTDDATVSSGRSNAGSSSRYHPAHSEGSSTSSSAAIGIISQRPASGSPAGQGMRESVIRHTATDQNVSHASTAQRVAPASDCNSIEQGAKPKDATISSKQLTALFFQ